MDATFRKIFFSRLGTIFSNVSVAAAAVAIAAVLAGILYGIFVALYFLLAIILVLVTLFIILALHPNLFGLVNADSATGVINFLINYVAPPAAVVSLVSSVLALLFLILGEPKKHVGRMVFSGVLVAISSVVTIAVIISAAGAR